MPRFSDNWVVDKSLFEYIAGGSCACCSFPIFNPDGLKGLINSISDIDTDAANAELQAAQRSPWPPEMRDQIWSERVRLRHKMKKEMKSYKEFMDEAGGSEGLKNWCKESLGPLGLRKIFQMPRAELKEHLHTNYNVHAAFGVVMQAVVDQVANFKATKYDTDGRGLEEVKFEENLCFDRRGGFVLNIAKKINSGQGEKMYELNEDVFDMFIDTFRTLGGPKLLHRKYEDEEGEEGEEGPDDPEHDTDSVQKGPSFRSDRRILRLLIAKYWADQIIIKWKASKQEMKVEN